MTVVSRVRPTLNPKRRQRLRLGANVTGTEWRNFAAIVSKGKTACEVSGHAIPDHFVTVNKMVNLGSGNALLNRGIRPECLPAAEDVKKVERRLTTEDKKSLKNPGSFDA